MSAVSPGLPADGAARSAPPPRWDDPGVDEVVPGIFRIPLPLPGDALRAVNVYAIRGARDLTLVDAGWHREDSWRALTAALGELGAEVGDIGRVLVTHLHRDHYGQATDLRRAGAASVLLGRGERPSLELIIAGPRGGLRAPWVERLRRTGAGELVAELDRMLRRDPDEPNPEGEWEPPDTWAHDGDRLDIGEHSLVALETPGHTLGHLTFLDEQRRLLFAGDHVLPHITPSIGFEPLPGPLPLLDFLLSLLKVRDLPVARVLPAHGDVFGDLRTRVDELLIHHANRLAASRDAVAGGELTAMEVARRLPWTRRQRHFDELDLFNRQLAVQETAAHLDLLEVQGTLHARSDDGVRRYRLGD